MLLAIAGSAIRQLFLTHSSFHSQKFYLKYATGSSPNSPPSTAINQPQHTTLLSGACNMPRLPGRGLTGRMRLLPNDDL
jgi:hypothetical protein